MFTFIYDLKRLCYYMVMFPLYIIWLIFCPEPTDQEDNKNEEGTDTKK